MIGRRSLWRLVAAAWIALMVQLLPVTAHAETVARDPERDILVMLRLPPPHYRPNAGYAGAYGDSQGRAGRQRVARSIARDNRLDLVESWPMPLIGIDCYVMRVPTDRSTETAAAEVSRDSRVEWAEPMRLYHAQGRQGVSGDPLFAAQPAAAAWHLADLHRVATGRGVEVAVVDSRIEADHPDLSGQFAARRDFVAGGRDRAERHGTGIAGVIAAKMGNGVGIAGIAPGARIMALRACWQTGSAATLCDSLSLAKAIHFAIDNGAEVINLSLSGPPNRLLEKLVGTALARDISVVSAFDPGLPGGGFPASVKGVIAVADETLPTLPPRVYAAPGSDVPTTQPGGRWYLVSGSSYAAAQVSGLLALLHERREEAGAATLVAASPAGGRIDACATIMPRASGCD